MPVFVARTVTVWYAVTGEGPQGSATDMAAYAATHECALLQSVITTLLLWPIILCSQVPAASGLPADSLPQPVPWQLPWTPVNLSTCLPQILGLGAIKGGTTALYAYIAQGLHPQLAVPKRKELNFWNHDHNFTDIKTSPPYLHKYLAHWHTDLQKSDDPIATLESQCNASSNQLVRLEVSCTQLFQCHPTSTEVNHVSNWFICRLL
jgi:hypothetical protein